MPKEFLEKLRDSIGEYCFNEGCHYSKKSEVYHECEFAIKCQLWQFLKFLYKDNEKDNGK